MPAEENTAPVTETVEQQSDDALVDREIESMLGRIPGLDQYFGEEKSAPKEAPMPAEEEIPTPSEEPAAEPVAPPEEAETVEEKEAVPASVQKRIDKLTAQKHEAIERAEALEEKVKELEGRVQTLAPLAPTLDSPLADVETAEDLSKRFISARQVKSWALEHLDGGEVEDGKGGTTFLDGSQVKKLLSVSESLITEHIPQRRQYLETRAVFDSEAKVFYPNMMKIGTDENKTLTMWVKIFPEVRKFPDYQLIILDALAGQKMRLAAKKKVASNGAAQRTPTLAAPSPSAGAKVTQKSVLSKDLLTRMATDRSALDVFSESLIGKGS